MVILLYKWSVLFHWFLMCYGGEATMSQKTALHPLYITVTEINYNATDKNLEISCKIFTDDFENALSALHHAKVDLAAPKDRAVAEKQVFDYLRSNLSIKLDGKLVSPEFVGYEKETDATWSYLQVPNTAKAPKTIEITNSLLYDAYDKQINLMHVSVGGTRKSSRLDYPDKEARFQF